jgi:cytidylate kinase
VSAVAIDGPAGAGKTTVARALAEKLGWSYVDTGAMYRALALAVIEANADPSEPSAVTAVAERSDIQLETGRILLNGRDVGSRIREDDVTAAAALVSKHPAAREVLVALQRRAAHSGDVVMEGRDIGTVVLPDAPVKVFLTATLDERAGRRALETGTDSGRTREGIERRDRSDAERVASPLRRAPGAVVIDTTDKTVDQVIEEIAELVLRSQEGKA